MIYTISDEPTLAGTSQHSLKHYVCSYAHQVFSAEQEHMPKMSKVGWESITFSKEEEQGIIFPHDDHLIIRANISNFDVGRIVDIGSLVNFMFSKLSMLSR